MEPSADTIRQQSEMSCLLRAARVADPVERSYWELQAAKASSETGRIEHAENALLLAAAQADARERDRQATVAGQTSEQGEPTDSRDGLNARLRYEADRNRVLIDHASPYTSRRDALRGRLGDTGW